jgi:hypothetical protein
MSLKTPFRFPVLQMKNNPPSVTLPLFLKALTYLSQKDERTQPGNTQCRILYINPALLIQSSGNRFISGAHPASYSTDTGCPFHGAVVQNVYSNNFSLKMVIVGRNIQEECRIFKTYCLSSLCSCWNKYCELAYCMEPG